MIGWFRRRPQPAQQPPKPDGWDDRGYAHAHGYTLTEWAALPAQTKRELRKGVAAALNERKTA